MFGSSVTVKPASTAFLSASPNSVMADHTSHCESNGRFFGWNRRLSVRATVQANDASWPKLDGYAISTEMQKCSRSVVPGFARPSCVASIKTPTQSGDPPSAALIAPSPVHNTAAHVHRQSPPADFDASSRRASHLNDARPKSVHQFRTRFRISPARGSRATARAYVHCAQPINMAYALQYTSGKSCGASPVAEIDAHKHSSSMARGYT